MAVSLKRGGGGGEGLEGGRGRGGRLQSASVVVLVARASSVSLYVHRDRTDYQGRGTHDVHLDLHTAPEL